MPTSERLDGQRPTRFGPMARLTLAAVAALILGLSLGASSALAILTHPGVTSSFDIGSNVECPSARGISVDEERELIYVGCSKGEGSSPTIRRFHFDGSPAAFEFTAPYVVGNELVGNPLSPKNEWVAGPQISVNNAPGSRNGYFAITAGCPACGPSSTSQRYIEIFKPTGEWSRELPHAELGKYDDASYGSDGALYALNTDFDLTMIRKFAPESLNEIERVYPLESQDFIRAESDGDVWTNRSLGFQTFQEAPQKHEKSAFTTDLSTKMADYFSHPLPEVPPSPYVSPSGKLPGVTGAVAMDVDIPSSHTMSDTVYVLHANKVQSFSSGTPEEFSHVNGPDIGSGEGLGNGLDVTTDGDLFAVQGRKVLRYGAGDILPDVRTPSPLVADLDHDQATVRAHIDRAGGGPITGCELEYGKDPNTFKGVAPEKTGIPCSPDPSGVNFTAATTDVSATTLAGLETGKPYRYRFKATNAKGSNFGGVREFTPPYVINVHTDPATVTELHKATLHGSFDPDGTATSYYFQWGLSTSYGQETALVPVASTPGTISVEATIASLPSGRTFHYRIAAKTVAGTTFGEDRVFRTASAPEIASVTATEVTANSATLHAQIDPAAFATTYHFEYGTTPEYGSSVPVPDESIGSGSGIVPVSEQLSGLQEGITYHFRVVAENKWGISVSDDTTFDYAPPSCPNERARQQTGSNYLPDCRAYELVSSPKAGSVVYFPSAMLPEIIFSGGKGFRNWPLNRGLATAPSRFTFFGALGAPDEVNPPNSLIDMYMATRTPTGWAQSFPGFTADEVLFSNERECSDSLDLCTAYVSPDHIFFSSPLFETAPHIFDSEGNKLMQLPSNVGEITGGTTFTGATKMSPDFSTLAFSSSDVAFTEDGVKLSETLPGSAYVNDVASGTVKRISFLPAGTGDIPRDVTLNNESNPAYIRFPGVSTNGSHVLMSVNGDENPADANKSGTEGLIHLYMYASGEPAKVYDVSRGFGVKFAGMTADGGTVYFAASQKLTLDDTDNSIDLYKWTEAGDTVTRISQAGGAIGNEDACTPVGGFTQKCGAVALTPEQIDFKGDFTVPGMDDRVARGSGDIYFYSPEANLDPDSPGLVNQRNLYLYRNGQVTLVASLDQGTQIQRIQISPDGSRAGFITKSKLTGYDNKGKAEMYGYNAETGVIRCASCRPDGSPPQANVEGSQSGPFMADNGRLFFATPESLVPQDSNGKIIDVYEFVDGRPQLITTGFGNRDTTGPAPIFPATHTGLESVSNNGTDVYFSTFETLVDEDTNGPFVKFYDARSGGGFSSTFKLAPCEAADECHGGTSAAPPAPPIATRNDLGKSGNVAASHKKKAKKKKKKHGKPKSTKRRHPKHDRRNRG